MRNNFKILSILQRDGDKWELRRHIFANGVDRHMIRRLLQKIFVPCSCPRIQDRTNNSRCPGHEVAISIDETVQSLDISEETIATLLCYLELHPKNFITVLSSVYVKAKVSSYGGPEALKAAAQSVNINANYLKDSWRVHSNQKLDSIRLSMPRDTTKILKNSTILKISKTFISNNNNSIKLLTNL